MDLSHDEISRYARHLSLPEIGPDGQMKIRDTSVLCVGMGGLGSPVVLYLAAAGIGKLGLVDFDTVDSANLQRQIIHGTPDLGRSKTQSAQAAIHRLNPHVQVVTYETRLAAQNALEILRPYDIIVDGSDNLPTRYLANDACVLLQKPNVYGSIFRFEGQASVFAPHLGGPCYRCFYPEPPPPEQIPTCAAAGVLGVVAGVIGCIQATEALKLAVGRGDLLMGRLLWFNALEMRFRELKVRRDPQCPACGEHRTLTSLIDYDRFCGTTPPAAPASPRPDDEVSVHDLKRALENPALGIGVIDVREGAECQIARIPGVDHIPLSELEQRWAELDPNRPYYIHCETGVRSLQAVEFLRHRGFQHVKSVRGGLRAWTQQIDPRLVSHPAGT